MGEPGRLAGEAIGTYGLSPSVEQSGAFTVFLQYGQPTALEAYSSSTSMGCLQNAH